jgi:hypothetical protein
MPSKHETTPYGSQVRNGEYVCADCGFVIQVRQRRPLPPCPQYDSSHVRRCWQIVLGKTADEPAGNEAPSQAVCSKPLRS